MPTGVAPFVCAGFGNAPEADFLPTDVAGLVTWLRSDLGVTLNGADVSAWTDTLSGGGRSVVQADAAKQPLFVASGQAGQPYIEFDGIDEYLKGTWTQATPLHMFVVGVANRTASETNDATIVDGGTGGAMRIYTSAADHTVMVGSSVAGALTEAGIDSTVCHAFELLSDGASSRFSLLDSPADTESGALTGGAVGGLTIGEYGLIGVGGICPCDVYEVIQYSAPLSAPDLADVTAYLLLRYGLGP